MKEDKPTYEAFYSKNRRSEIENRRLLENEGSETVLNFILKNQQI
jgi:hypothetical protein